MDSFPSISMGTKTTLDRRMIGGEEDRIETFISTFVN